MIPHFVDLIEYYIQVFKNKGNYLTIIFPQDGAPHHSIKTVSQFVEENITYELVEGDILSDKPDHKKCK